MGCKESNQTNKQNKVNFKGFLNQTLCRRDFHSVTWVMPQGLGHGGVGGQIFLFSEHGHVAYQIKRDEQ